MPKAAVKQWTAVLMDVLLLDSMPSVRPDWRTDTAQAHAIKKTWLGVHACRQLLAGHMCRARSLQGQ